jgi:DNA-binding NtrC family response regulator
MLRMVLFPQSERVAPTAFVRAAEKCGLEAVLANTEADFFQRVRSLAPESLAVLYSPIIDSDTIRLVENIRRFDHFCPQLLLTSSISTDTTISAMRAGAWDVLEHNAPVEKLIATLKTLEKRLLEFLVRPSENELFERERMVGSGTAMTRIRDQLSKIAAVDMNVMITGESGTGKELAAALIHQNSRRRGRPFVAINCAAVPDTLLESELFGHERGAFTGANAAREGKLQHAAGGTLFLDEIGDMSLMAQAKILRAVDSRVIQRLGSNVDTRVQVRLIAATNQDLGLLTQEKRFRQDLYYRLSVVHLTMPPLRERQEDIPELVEHMVRDWSRQYGKRAPHIANSVTRCFQFYHWPGNVRELRNVLESILVYSASQSIGLNDIPSDMRHTLRPAESSYEDERSRIVSALASVEWNRDHAARILCCSRMTLYRKMAKFGISSPEKGIKSSFVTFPISSTLTWGTSLPAFQPCNTHSSALSRRTGSDT